MTAPPGWVTLFTETWQTPCAETTYFANYPNWVGYSSGSDGNQGSWSKDTLTSVVTPGIMQFRCVTDSSGNATGPSPIMRHFPGQASGSFTSGLTSMRWQYAMRCVSPVKGWHYSGLMWPDSNTWVAEDDWPELDFLSSTGVVGTPQAFHHHYTPPSGPATAQDSYTATGFDMSAWHTYGFEWVSGSYVKLYIDDMTTPVKTFTTAIPTVPMRGPTLQNQTSPNSGNPPIANQSQIIEFANLEVYVPGSTAAAAGRVSKIFAVSGTSSRVSKIGTSITGSGGIVPTTPGVTGLVEMEFVPGSNVFTDISGRCTGVQIQRPRPDVGQDRAPTTISLTFLNHPATQAEITAWGLPTGAGYSPFLSDSPVAAFYPNVTNNRRVRVTWGWNGGANSSVRGIFWTDYWVPDAGDTPPATATVSVTASDVRSKMATYPMLSDYGQTLVTTANNDYWPYNEDSNAQYLSGYNSNGAAQTAYVANAYLGTGSLTFQKPDGQILVDGAANFARGSDGDSVGPVIFHPLRSVAANTVSRVSAWFQLSGDTTTSTSYVEPVMSAWLGGQLVWSLVVITDVNNKVSWVVNQSDNATPYSVWHTTYSPDDSWNWISVLPYDLGGGQWTMAMAVRNQVIPDQIVTGGYSPIAGALASNRADTICIGGMASPRTPHKPTGTFQGNVSSLWVNYNTPLGTSYSALSSAAYTQDAHARDLQLLGYTSNSGLTPTPVGLYTPDTALTVLTGLNDNLLDAWNEHARTTGGAFFTNTGGQPEYLSAGNTRLSTVRLMLDAQADLSAPDGGWVGIKDPQPTRINVTSPVGNTLAVNTALESNFGYPVAAPDLATAAGSLDVAAQAGYRILAADTSRLSSFGVDATTMAAAAMTNLMNLQISQRIRITNLTSSYTGLTYRDVYANGWTETYDAESQSLSFQFDTDPADDPPEGFWDDATYGRFAIDAATVTSGTAVGSVLVGTIVVTGDDPISVAAGDYPLDLNWNGERVTVSAAPATSTSPQTLTITARGVAPSVARVHAAGETIDIWFALTPGV